MNISASQRALLTLALGSILTLGVTNQASARDNPRDHADQENARGNDARHDKAGDKERGHGARRGEAAPDQPPAASAEAPRQDDVQRETQRRNGPQRQPRPQVDPRQDVQRQDEQRQQATQPLRDRNDLQRAARQDGDMQRPTMPQAERRDPQPRDARRSDEQRQDASRQQHGQWQRREDVRRPDDVRQPQQRPGREQSDRDQRGRDQSGRDQQDQRIRAENQRADRYRQAQVQRSRMAELRARQLQQQRRIAQYRYEQQYVQRLRQQQANWSARGYNPYNDQYFYTPSNYRYAYGGGYRQTNRYGADLIRQAVNYGYEEGLRAGRADRQDGWRDDYRGSYGYQDASYGYNGYYVDQDVYNHYFREGFQRGYQDGYSSHYRYGRGDNNGNYAILAVVLSAIVGLELLH